MTKPTFRLGELLLQAGAITRAQLSAALAAQSQSGGRLGTKLIELGAVDERTLSSVLSEQLRIPAATAAQLEKATVTAIALVPRELAEKHRAVPVRIDQKRLWVVFADPTDTKALQALERKTGMEVRPMVAPDVLIDFALQQHYGVQRKARVIEVRDSGLLDIGPVPGQAAVYDAHPARAQANLGFLDERPSEPPRPSPPPIPKPAGPVGRASPSGVIDGDRLREQLLAATQDDEIFERLLDALQPVCGRLVLLLIRDRTLVAHRARGLDAGALSFIRVPLDGAAELMRLLEAATPQLGPLPSQLGALLQPPGTPTGLALPVTLGKRAVGVVFGGEVAADLGGQQKALERVITLADLALHARHVRARLARA